MENRSESQLPVTWQHELNQQTAGMDEDRREELEQTTKAISDEIQQALRILTAALGDENGVKIRSKSVS